MVPAPDFIAAASAATILVVEDEALVRLQIADALRENGFSVVEAARGDEALAYLETVGGIDVVFTDIQMPGPVNGLDLAREVRVRFPAVPVVLTSGMMRPHPGDPGMFIPKPYDPQQVVAVVVSLLRRGRDHA